MPWKAVCLSVCPPVTRRYCVETANHIIKLFNHRVATPFLFFFHFFVFLFSVYDLIINNSSFFHTKRYDNKPVSTEILQWGRRSSGVWKNRDFRLIFRFISEMIQDRAMVAFGTPIGTRMWSIKWCHLRWLWMTLSELAKYSITRNIARSLCDSWASRVQGFRSSRSMCVWCTLSFSVPARYSRPDLHPAKAKFVFLRKSLTVSTLCLFQCCTVM